MTGRTHACFGAAAVFLMGVLVWTASLEKRSELLALSDAARQTEKEIQRLEEEHSQLKAAQDAATDLEAVETFARQELGMGRPREEQLLYARASLPDRAEVVGKETDPWKTWVRELPDRLRNVLADKLIY